MPYGQAQNFILVNSTDYIISYVYVSQSSPEDRDEDILTVDVLDTNEECEIVFAGHEECLWGSTSHVKLSNGSTARLILIF